VVRIPIPPLGFDHHLRAAVVPADPSGFNGIDGFRPLNRFLYGNSGDPTRCGLET
jgi:hypothetical protein